MVTQFSCVTTTPSSLAMTSTFVQLEAAHQLHKDIPEFYQLNSLSSSRPRDLDPLCFGDDIYSYFIYERSQVLIWVPIFNFNTIPETRFPNKGDILESWTTPRQAVKQNPGGENVEISRKKKKCKTSSLLRQGSRAGSAGWGRPDPTSIGVESEEGAAGAGGGRRYNLGW